MSEETGIVKLEWAAAAALLNKAEQVIIVAHVNPDGDAIGSLCGLSLALREMGKTVTAAVDEGVPRYLKFIPGAETVVSELDSPEADRVADLVIFVDVSDTRRPGKAGQVALSTKAPLLVIDHHVSNDFFGTANLVRSEAVSTTEIIYDWLNQLEHPLSESVASALLTGIITDTQAFRVGPITAHTLELAGKLMSYGANLKHILENTVNFKESGVLQLQGRAFSRAKLQDGVMWTYLEASDFQELNLPQGDSLSISSELVTDENAVIGVVFVGLIGDGVRLSIRSVPGFDVSQAALQLGGGGHAQAAGCQIENVTIAEAIEKALPLLIEEAKRGKAVYR